MLQLLVIFDMDIANVEHSGPDICSPVVSEKTEWCKGQDTVLAAMLIFP